MTRQIPSTTLDSIELSPMVVFGCRPCNTAPANCIRNSAWSCLGDLRMLAIVACAHTGTLGLPIGTWSARIMGYPP